MRLRFFWWGWKPKFWLRIGRGWTIVADKDYSVKTLWTFDIGPLQIEWWNRSNWKHFCFTPEEYEEDDRLTRAAPNSDAQRQ